MLNVYDKDSEGLSSTNMHKLEQAAICFKALQGPWIAGGDWKSNPSFSKQPAGSIWLVVLCTRLINPHVTDMCTTSSLYIKQSHLVGVQRLENGGLFPHFPTRLLVKGGALRYFVRKLIKPGEVLGYLPAGPPSPPPSYDDVLAHIANDPND